MGPAELDRSLDIATALALAITLWATGIGLGISVGMSDIVGALGRRRLVGRIVVLDLLLVPIAMWVCVRLLVPDEAIATGLLLVAFAAAGPLGIKLVQLAGGDAALAIGLVVTLELANLVAIPLWSSLLGITSTLDVAIDIVRTLVLLVLAPLAGGLLIGRRLRVEGRRRLEVATARIGNVGLVLVVAVVVGRNLDTIGPSTIGAVVAAAIVVAFALAAGWVVGGPDRPRRISASLVTGVRANAAALAIATTSLAHLPGVALGVVIAGLVSVVAPTLVAVLLALHASRERDPGRDTSGPLRASG
jgi:BASS family bile acid:Na+ symporter